MAPPVTATAPPPASPAPTAVPGRWIAVGAAVLAALAAASFAIAWSTQQRVKTLETELVRRQQDAAAQVAEARTASRDAQEVARDVAAKMTLLDERVAETTLQRSQLEDLIQSLARSRDENVLADIDSSIRVAVQQSAITGSAEPLVAALKQTDERLSRLNQPRLERVRRAVAQDLDRARSAGATDISVLTIRIDEVIRVVDDLPLLAQPGRRPAEAARAPAAAASAPA
ncbi:MAG: uroporphyrinogen-III C-methyltransferase, partial [Burkholderiales bacterium]|nr:uroporphyrinogen-III C-methyltransferase [Burkholderiales bacterium]